VPPFDIEQRVALAQSRDPHGLPVHAKDSNYLKIVR
jgi:hypothetical protein